MNMKRQSLLIFFILSAVTLPVPHVFADYSVAGFYLPDDSPRKVFSMNPGWRFSHGNPDNAPSVKPDGSEWLPVNLPHTLNLVPLQGSGGVNLQEEAWYRKLFTVPVADGCSRYYLHFEGVMGKSEYYLNGEKIFDHEGGYLPVQIDITDYVEPGEKALLAVKADNRDDSSYPPGKKQSALDFSYFGGIYRDVYLICLPSLHITDAVSSGTVAGGGLFVAFDDWDENGCTAVVSAEIANFGKQEVSADVTVLFCGLQRKQTAVIRPSSKESVRLEFRLENPKLWSPRHPHLEPLTATVSQNGTVTDKIVVRCGIRRIEITAENGLILNGKPYPGKLIGGNRHQDYAYVGNALPNSGQYRDALKMKEAGMEIVRAAHYPMDPAFMDACDELGLFVIVPTPGWQFWNPAPSFGKKVIADIRAMVRRDRNRPSVLMWEPVPNETFYPASFAPKAHRAVHEEYPFSGCYTVADKTASGSSTFDVCYEHPYNNYLYKTDNISEKMLKKSYEKEKKPIFNREWGDNVDDWNSHNSPSRVLREWGEAPQLIQMLHYAIPDYEYTAYNTLFLNPPQFIGGTLWHTFDHNRGYHPDPFYGGIFDAFRQPKYSYYLFKAQNSDSPFVKILHELTPFSGKDIWVVSDCDEIRLSVFGKTAVVKKSTKARYGMPYPPICFEDAFDFMELKSLTRSGLYLKASVKAEGWSNGVKVAETEIRPAYRPEKIVLKVDDMGLPLRADGGDFVPVIAGLTDKNGTVKRLSSGFVRFRVEGEGQLIDDGVIGANPAPLRWGEAVALVRTTTVPGKITVTAEPHFPGIYMPEPVSVTLTSVASEWPFTDSGRFENRYGPAFSVNNGTGRSAADLEEVSRQQTAFE